MKKLFYLALVLLISSCAGGGSYRITGTVKTITTGDSVMLFNYAKVKSETPRLATRITTPNDMIDLSGRVAEPQVAMFLKYKLNVNANYGTVFLEDGQINVAVDEQRERIFFTGTPLNDIYTNYLIAKIDIENKQREKMRDSMPRSAGFVGLAQSETVALLMKCINANMDNLVGAYLFVTEEFPHLSPKQAADRLDQFPPELRKYKFMREAIEATEAKLRTEPGEKYFDITLLDSSNKKHSLSHLIEEGKYVLVDFWVSWSVPYKSNLPELRDVYAQYKERGFEIYGISMDTNRVQWSEMIEQMPWINTVRSSGSTVVSDYAVTTLPTNFLISPQGIIIAKDINGEQVRQLLDKYLE